MPENKNRRIKGTWQNDNEAFLKALPLVKSGKFLAIK